MEFKGTKGKWQVSISNEYSGEYSIRNEKYSPTFGEDIYNAKLIESAPEMFEFISSLENDNNSIPKFMWDKRNELLIKITEK